MPPATERCYQVMSSPRADPGFEVRGGANGFDNLKTRGGGGGGHIYFKYTTITITYIYIYIYISITIHFKISNTTIFFIPTSPLYYIVLKNLIWNFFRGGRAPGAPPSKSALDLQLAGYIHKMIPGYTLRIYNDDKLIYLHPSLNIISSRSDAVIQNAPGSLTPPLFKNMAVINSLWPSDTI